VPIAPRNICIFEAQVEEDQENIDVVDASQEDEGHEDVEREVKNEDEEVKEQSSNNSNDDEDIEIEIEYDNLIRIDIDIGLDTMRDVIEDEFDEESLTQNNEEEM
jgi:hypothetical protein